ncbi:terpene utilization protein AtuA [Pseudovibrio japonicus]|uniref:Terpene utilization protein AtuA n=1 Tax=Pseudovibrio japonicus TaxID=366534 RepID=A0ABQ3E9M0_9HYPH|nr:acyclic terpene utilization AtuA family protein [Pseudovibrio japonicus]GHB29519.1 terpene utilization protein AtuA [Pseudovibrio japonicus]
MSMKSAENQSSTDQKSAIRIGGACGFWGDSSASTGQLLRAGDLDYIVYDYLAEITLSIMARARQKSPDLGYATDFVEQVLGLNLKGIAASGTKILSNAGGVNPESCVAKIREMIAAQKLDLKVAVVTGDDLLENAASYHDAGVAEMFSGEAFPKAEKVASINAYLGAQPVVAALAAGADIVITGRCADSALTLAACVHAFGWGWADYDRLAAGSLVGHLLECGTQVTGGNFTDWRDVPEVKKIGYPIATVYEDGSCDLSKPDGSGGLVSVGTVAEQLVYEIGDPQAYLLPDVTCDFSAVTVEAKDAQRVHVSGARGAPAPDHLKVSATWADGFRVGLMVPYLGFEAGEKAQALAELAVGRAESVLKRLGAPGYQEVSIEVVGAGSQSGEAPVGDGGYEEVVLKIAARHVDQRAAGLLLRELVGLGLSVAPGMATFNGGRPKPSPVVRLFSFLVLQSAVVPKVYLEGESVSFDQVVATGAQGAVEANELPAVPACDEAMSEVPLIKLAYARSGDKGDKANIGVIARQAEWLPWIAAALTEEAVAKTFTHFDPGNVSRFYLPGCHALNFLIDDVLGGGGVASLRLDPQAKAYSQILLRRAIPVPHSIAQEVL